MSGLAAAVAEFELSQRGDTLLRDKHWTLCWQAIMGAIKKGDAYVDYEVPAQLYGPYPVFRQRDMVMHVLQECRRNDFTVQVPDPAGATLRISGWAEKARSKREEDAEFRRHFSIVSDSAHLAGHQQQQPYEAAEVVRVPKVQQLGKLSAHLKQVAARAKK